MAKYKLQEMGDMRYDGKRRVYPKMVTNRTLSRKEFVKMMQNYHRGISESTTEAVLTDVVDMLTDMLSMGYNVNLEGFGTFSISLAFEDEKPREILNPDDKMTYRKVGVKDINFKASPEFVKDVKRETDRDLERDMGGVKVIRKQLYSREERIARALLSTAAFNAFLKTLEEPPAHVIFILATTEKHKILPTILSRCQIYDFERMTVENTIAHLKHVADKEGIKYEEEALGIIAEKADGGMRDALSIFDQAASFCQGNITYQKVIEDLNELDADNYFRIVDLAMENKVSDIMLLLNSIIEKGFDGGNLINGLASHVRNVLMAKDASTLTLLEVSKQQRDKYAEQAQRCPTRFLYTALKIMNQCDLNYRQSSNKRLLVELTLIQVAQITQPEDTADGAGRSPKRLKSLFIHLTTARNTAAQQVATPGKNLGYGTNKTGTAALSVVSNDTEALSQAMTAAANTITSAASLASAQTDNKPKPKAIKLSGLGITFQSLKRKQEAAVKQEAEITNKEENEEFTQELLELQWLSMCNRMPQKMIALASRMKNVKPHISNFPEIEIVVDNQILLDQINEIKGRIRVTLAKALHNGSVNLTLRLAEAEEISRKLTKKEVFDELMKQKEVRSFVESMGLELT